MVKTTKIKLDVPIWIIQALEDHLGEHPELLNKCLVRALANGTFVINQEYAERSYNLAHDVEDEDLLVVLVPAGKGNGYL